MSEALPLCGLWIDNKGRAHASTARDDARAEAETPFEPFFWSQEIPEELANEARAEELEGTGAFRWQLSFENASAYERTLKAARKDKLPVEALRPLEHQYLLQHRERYFKGLGFGELRRCQLDIETAFPADGRFSNPKRAGDRILSIGLRMAGDTTLLHLEDDTDEAERALLEKFNTYLQRYDPDIIEGHNLFKFDLDYLHQRNRRFKLPCAWGRFGGALATFRNSRLRVAERWVDFPRCDIPGRTVVDTYFMVMLFDISRRDLPSYSLKDTALHLGISEPSDRTYLAPRAIQEAFHHDRPTFEAYLSDDLRETAGLADLLLPTYIAQAESFPMTLQEILLRGTGSKIDTLFAEPYYHARTALPAPSTVETYAGGFTKSFQEGVFHGVLHFDVASLYPSLLLHIGRNPASDSLGVFMPLLKELRHYRLDYKQRARQTEDPELRREYEARQASFKIIINSFYGYLGFEGARFADGQLAAEVTERGRQLLQALIDCFETHDCTVLEADTDGIYLSSERHADNPQALLAIAAEVLPESIELEFDGHYESMFCYKAKNYALYDGEHVTIRGSALRSRGTEPFLKELTDTLIHHLLGTGETLPHDHLNNLRTAIENGAIGIDRLAKKEYLSQNPDKYRESIARGGKPRRASLEAALLMEHPPRMGEQVTYYITIGEKKRLPDWQLARPIDLYDPENTPYNTDYYLRKLDDWEKRYRDFLPEAPSTSTQGELF